MSYIKVFEMKFSRILCKLIAVIGRWNEQDGRRLGVIEKLNERVDRKVLKWFEHVERMKRERLTKIACEFDVEGERDKRSPCTM